MQTQKIAAKNKDDIVDEDYKAFDISEGKVLSFK